MSMMNMSPFSDLTMTPPYKHYQSDDKAPVEEASVRRSIQEEYVETKAYLR
jgi:hypothetical protein